MQMTQDNLASVVPDNQTNDTYRIELRDRIYISCTFALPAVSFPARSLKFYPFPINIRRVGRSKWPLIIAWTACSSRREAAPGRSLMCTGWKRMVHFMSSKWHGINVFTWNRVSLSKCLFAHPLPSKASYTFERKMYQWESRTFLKRSQTIIKPSP